MRRTAVVSEHALLRDTIARAIEAAGVPTVTAATPAQLRAAAPATLILDLDHATADAQELLKSVGAQFPDTHVVVLGTAAKLGASSDGVAHIELETPRTTAATLLTALKRGRAPAASRELVDAHRRWSTVTPRQREVLRWLAIGLDNRAIAVELKITARAVKAHVSALLVAFSLESRTDLALLAQAAGARPPVR